LFGRHTHPRRHDPRQGSASSYDASLFTNGQRNFGNRYVYAQRTRFIPNGITKHFQSRTWPPPAISWRHRPIDMKARMRGMWGDH